MSALILERIGNSPMVRLDRLSNGLPVPVLGKCEFLNPGGSGKDRIALAIVDDAERRNLVTPGSTVFGATAGYTGIGLALVAAARGYRLVCVMPKNTSTRITTRRTWSRGSAAASCPRSAIPGDRPGGAGE